MYLRAGSILRTHLRAPKFRTNLTAEVAGWLFLFGAAGIVYFFAQANNTWPWVKAFVAALFLVVILGIGWEWVLSRRAPANSRNAILAGVLFWLLLDPLVWREGIDEFSPDVIVKALLYAGIFIAAICAGYLVPAFPGVKRFFSRMPLQTKDDRIFWLTVAIYLLGIVPQIYISGGSPTEFWRLLLAGYSPDIEVGWRRGMLGNLDDFLKSTAHLLELSIPFLGVYLLRRQLAPWKKPLLLLMMISVFLIIFFSGERRVFALIALGPLLYLFFVTAKPMRRKLTPVFLAGALVLFWMMQAQVQFRSAGFYEFDPAVVQTNPLEMHRDNNFYWFATAVDTMPSMYEFTNEWVFLQIFTHPIPRFLWPGKPYTVGLPFVQWDEVGASLSISIVGELYVSQGLTGIILGGLLYGWMARNWDQLREYFSQSQAISLVYSVGLTLLLIGVRSFGDIVLNWYVLAIVILALRLSGQRVRSRQWYGLIESARLRRSGVTL